VYALGYAAGDELSILYVRGGAILLTTWVGVSVVFRGNNAEAIRRVREDHDARMHEDDGKEA
jgi:hypothetical protein